MKKYNSPVQNFSRVFTVADYHGSPVDLFDNPTIPTNQVAKMHVVSPPEETDQDYSSFVERISNGEILYLGKLRLEFMEKSAWSELSFSREIGGVVHKKAIPIVSFVHNNQYMPNIMELNFESCELPLDGKTIISLNPVFGESMKLTITDYRQFSKKASYESSQPQRNSANYDEMFLKVINNKKLFYHDYIHLANKTIDSQTFRLFFTPQGICIDNDNVTIVKKGLCAYAPGEEVFPRKIVTTKGAAQWTENIVIGGVDKIEGADPANVIVPICNIHQFLSEIHILNWDKLQKIENAATPIYTYRLLSNQAICFFFVNGLEVPPSGLEQKIMLSGPDSDTPEFVTIES